MTLNVATAKTKTSTSARPTGSTWNYLVGQKIKLQGKFALGGPGFGFITGITSASPHADLPARVFVLGSSVAKDGLSKRSVAITDLDGKYVEFHVEYSQHPDHRGELVAVSVRISDHQFGRM